MKRIKFIVFLAIFLILSFNVDAKNYRVYSIIGDVVTDSGHTLSRNHVIKDFTIVKIARNSAISIIDNNKVYTYGGEGQIRISDLINHSKGKLASRIMSYLSSKVRSEWANVSYKDGFQYNELVYAYQNPTDYQSYYDIRLELVDSQKQTIINNSIKIGDTFYIRVHNSSDIPLFVEIIWIDSSGNVLPIFGNHEEYVIIPALSTVDFKDMPFTATAPIGTDTIMLLADNKAFNMGVLLSADETQIKDYMPKNTIGLYTQYLNIR